MVNTAYTVHTKTQGDFVADFNTADPNSITRGETATFDFETELGGTTPDLVISDNETFTVPAGTTESFDDVIVEAGGTLVIESTATLQCNTLTNNGTITNNGTLTVQTGLVTTGALLEFFEWAGNYSTIEMLDGSIKYRTQIPESLNIETLAVGIEPNTDLQDRQVRGVWGLINSIEDLRNTPLSTDRYRFEIEVLGQYSAYSSFTDLENKLQI